MLRDQQAEQALHFVHQAIVLVLIFLFLICLLFPVHCMRLLNPKFKSLSSASALGKPSKRMFWGNLSHGPRAVLMGVRGPRGGIGSSDSSHLCQLLPSLRLALGACSWQVGIPFRARFLTVTGGSGSMSFLGPTLRCDSERRGLIPSGGS